jgi:hypothetical protein
MTMIQRDAKCGAAHHFLVAGLAVVGVGVLIALLFPANATSRNAALRNQSLNNLKIIAEAMLRYERKHGHLPPAVITGPDGKTQHSWRVELLPYLGQQKLYDEYRLMEPWDSEHNKALIERMPEVYQSPGSNSTGTAAYFVPIGKGTLFGSENGTKLGEIQDNPLTTIMLLDAKREIPWTKPEDIEIDLERAHALPKVGGLQMAVFLVAFADGTVDCFDNELDPAKMREMLTIAGGEQVDVPDRRPLSP